MDKKKVVSSLKNNLEKNVEKVNPLNKPIDKNDTSDTGFESSKVGYKTIKKGKDAAKLTVKTGKTTYKATKNTAKAAKNVTKKAVKTTKAAAKATKKTAKATAKATKTAVRATKATVKATIQITKAAIKIATEVTVQVIAALSNPYVLAAVLIIAIIAVIVLMLVALIGGGGGAAAKVQTDAYRYAAGLEMDVSEILESGEEYFNRAAEKQKNEYDALIDSLYFNTGDVQHCDLLFAVATPSGLNTDKVKADPEHKQAAKAIYDRSVSELEAIALVYIYLEKQENEANGTEYDIYEVEFTDEIFDELLDDMVSWSDTVFEKQECPEKNCTIHVEERHNPEWDTAKENRDTSVNAYYEWRDDIQPLIEKNAHIPSSTSQRQDWDNNIQWRIDNWNLVYSSLVGNAYTSNYGYDCLGELDYISDYYITELNKTPETIVEQTTTCDREHDYHSIHLNVKTADQVMNTWNFDATERQWYELTFNGLQFASETETDETEETS